MKNLYILLFSLFSITAFSQSFTRHTIEQQSINPNDIHPTDIDGDGDLDLLMNDGIEATYWYESYGGSFFFQHRISRTGDGFQPWDTHSADFDEDGAMDVVVSGEKGIVAYKNKGEGDFWSSKSVSTYITRVHNLLIADIDGDSRLDIIAYGGSTGKELVWFEYQGTGTQGTESWNDFSEEHIVSNNVEIESMYAADLDKDGDVDIVFSYNDEINWLSNDGKGNFSTPITIPTEAFEIRSTSMKDIDNDGDMDILTTYFNDNLVVLYENNGTANFTQRTLSSTIPKSFIQSIIDIDSDGDRDILLTSGNTNINDLFWLENNGQNNFLAPQVFYEKESAVINASESFSVWVADLNGDSHLDLITNSSLETLAWHQNDGNGNFSESIIIKTNLDEPTSLIATDLNEDEFPDIVVGMVGTGRILWYPNDGQGDFSKPVEIAKERLITRIEVQCADIDNDGHIDVVAYFNTIEESKKTVWYKNDGKGNFSTKKPIAGGRSIGLHLTDFDSDGDLDLVSTFVGKVQWAENYGIGNFSGLKLLYEDFSFNYYWNASSTDLNLDGYMDILVPGQVTIEWLRNTGFESVQNFSIRPGFRLDRLSVVDVDDDGYEDVFTFSQVADKINYFQNKNGNLTLRNTISSVDVHPYTDIDLIEFRSWERSIVISDYSSNQIKFYHYYDLSTPYQTLYGVNGAAGVDGADMDNDGDVDLVTIGEKGNQLIWYENQRIVDKDKDGYRDGYDCDDNNPAINPQATEIPNNGIDDDCNGFDLITGSESAAICPMASVEIAALTDNSVTLRFAGSLDSTYLIRAEELVEFLGNEWDEEEFEGNQVNYMELEPCTEFAIQVASICGSSQTDFSEILIFKTTGPCPTDADNDGFLADIDCDDGDATIHPEAIEIPNNGIDEDCDGTDLVTLVDADNDGFTEDVDCDDTNAAINPAATEITNSGIDENCDGISFMIDEDNDGHNSSIDCDDTNPNINSSATEIPNNGIDEDCDGADLVTLKDADNDGFTTDVDCDDNNPAINPAATEIANSGFDENCDGVSLMIDEDEDGHNSSIDCDDTNPNINSSATEIPNNGIDEDCDGADLVTLKDADNDGFTTDVDCDDNNPAINPAATEIANSGFDENCDGISFIIDEDEDGHNSSIDCDDNNPDINSSAIEIPNNGIDEDCDGIDLITVTCSPPTVSIDSTSNTWFFASWDAISPSYTIRLKEVLEEEWLEIETWTGTDLIFSTLQPCTFYEFQVASECETTKSVFSASSFIFTGGCSELYCHAYGLAYENWIEAIAVNGEGNTTGQDYGYGNYQHLAPSPLGEEATIQLIPGTNSTSIQKVFWSVWIDFNLNFEFEEEERVVFLEADNQMPINTSFTIPSGAFPGPLRLRIIMDVDIAQDACGTEGFREVEDYSLYIQQNLGVTAPSSTSDNHFFKLISSPSFTSENSIGTLSNQSIKSVMPLTNNSIQVAPNPIQDQFFIFIASERQADFKVQLVDIAGRALQQFQVTPNEWQPHQIDHLQSGVYLLQVDQNGLSETIKIIKQ